MTATLPHCNTKMLAPQQASGKVNLQQSIGKTASEIKSAVLDLGRDTLPPKTWWSSVKQVSRDSFKLVASRSQGFQIREEDLILHERLGDGLRSIAFKAELAELNSERRKVVVKHLRSPVDSDNAEKTVEDLRVVSNSLRHPNIVEFIGVSLNEANQSVSIVCEHMSGGTLEDYLVAETSPKQHVPFSRVVRWSLQMFHALKFLHERENPIIHRDLKPCNLLLSADYTVLKLRDFGVAKTCNLGIAIFGSQQQQASAVLTTDTSLLAGPSKKGFTGTARYMAPEIDLKNPASGYSTAVDVYSAALIMWFMLEGERPFEGYHGHVAMEVTKKCRRPPLLAEGARQYPESMAKLIKHCWAHLPSARPRASEAIQALQMLAETAPE